MVRSNIDKKMIFTTCSPEIFMLKTFLNAKSCSLDLDLASTYNNIIRTIGRIFVVPSIGVFDFISLTYSCYKMLANLS